MYTFAQYIFLGHVQGRYGVRLKKFLFKYKNFSILYVNIQSASEVLCLRQKD